jgi:O-antigen/teichoic acid export membrane protein
VLVLGLPLLIAPELLLSLVFGAEFGSAATALRIVVLGQVANAAFGPNVPLLNMANQERRVTRAMMIGVILNAVTVVFLAHNWGIVGGALGFVASLLCWNVLTWLDARRFLGVETSILGRPRVLRA